jgi:hypothetical protein
LALFGALVVVEVEEEEEEEVSAVEEFYLLHCS